MLTAPDVVNLDYSVVAYLYQPPTANPFPNMPRFVPSEVGTQITLLCGYHIPFMDLHAVIWNICYLVEAHESI